MAKPFQKLDTDNLENKLSSSDRGCTLTRAERDHLFGLMGGAEALETKIEFFEKQTEQAQNLLLSELSGDKNKNVIIKHLESMVERLIIEREEIKNINDPF